MDIKEIFSIQANFDQFHFPELSLPKDSPKENLQLLTFLTLGALGELGEFANILKKVNRGDLNLTTANTDMKEELADVFIYLIKLCQALDIDLEKAYLEKLEKNKTRFHDDH